MKKFVFTIKDDICSANGKDVNASELLAVMGHYGTVEDYEKVVSSVKGEYQEAIDHLSLQLNAIKDQQLTDDEIRVVKNYRDCKSAVVAQYTAEINTYKTQLTAVKQENEQRNARIMAILGE